LRLFKNFYIILISLIRSVLQRLEQLGIIREITGRKWNKMYAYKKALAVLERGVGINLV